MSNPNDFNQQIIAAYRASGGQSTGPFPPGSLILLNTVGAKSGQPRTNPLVFTTDGDRLVIIASKAGAPTNPDWYYNVLAQPLVTVEQGNEKFQARAVVPTGAERDRLYMQMAALMPQFAEYERNTSRQMPVIVLERML